MTAGLLSGAIAAVAAALLSLPLHAPNDTLFNTASVTLGALAAGVAAGALWSALAPRPERLHLFGGAWALAFLAILAALAVGDGQLERLLAFGAPLAALILGVTGVLTPLLNGARLPRLWLGGAAAVAALALGVAFAGEGDAESGALSLPPRVEATPTATPAAATPAATTSTPAAATPTPVPTPQVGVPPFVAPSQLEGVRFTVGDGSEATFAVTEQLAVLPLPNEAVVRTSGLSGEIHLDGRPTVITIDLRALSSDQSRRDRYIRNTMFPDHETATLTVEGIGTLPESYDGEVLEREVTGLLSIHGVEAAVPFTVEARLDGEMLFVLGRGTFTWQQLEIEPPSSAAAVSVEDEVRVEVLLAARAALDAG